MKTPRDTGRLVVGAHELAGSLDKAIKAGDVLALAACHRQVSELGLCIAVRIARLQDGREPDFGGPLNG